ncbi:MAG TPA: tannase/feruloyl esterase family alpha/beta hydrolase [Acidobacteriaceae bacterium]|jgi:feruloyl esterase|nr:tannase/feruloyl esterase family alpha/beta hydrolase [Acidobacteriaceae bacterium]
MMLKTLAVFTLVLITVGARCQSMPCHNLTGLSLPNARVVLAQTVAAGTFRLPTSTEREVREGIPFRRLPAFCRVVLSLTPAQDSDIAIELWLPIHQWNGRLMGVGNGGFAGEIDYRGLATAVGLGYATAATNTGHQGSFTDAEWALGHPEKVIDFGYRAIHLMTTDSKTILKDFYAAAARYSYFESCSTGGRQALMEAQRFPADYNGILAGAPANNWTMLMTNAVVASQALSQTPASYISPAKLPAIHSAVLAACDAQDGVRDGILNDPRRCHFDPSVLLCRGHDNDQCLTQPQVTALRTIDSGLRDRDGHPIYPGYEPGGELGSDDGWAAWLLGPAPGNSLISRFGTRYFRDMVYSNPQWSPEPFNVTQALQDAEKKTGEILNATNPDLRQFADRGGKLILYHGWSDAAIPPVSTINYYNDVRRKMGSGRTDKFVRLYMAPGMQHCELGPGPNSFGQNGPSSASGAENARHDIRLALQAWVEDAVAPSSIIAAKYAGDAAGGKIVMTRPLCAYPLAARYNGTGDPDQASSFVCAPEP